MIPATVADATGHNGISRRAKDRTCVCGAAILVGLDAERCAGEAKVDVAPVTAVGEALAILSGRATYRLYTAGRLELDHRSRWHITGDSAEAVTVLAEHVCGSSPLPTRPATIPTTKELPDEPDY